MPARSLRLLVVVLLCLLPAALHAQVQASLVALKKSFRADAREIVVAVRLAHEPKWHTYWLQPGTGLPTEIKWDLPPGWSAGPIRWPAPKRVYDTAGNLAGNGYEGVTYLPVTLTPPAGVGADAPVTLRARVEWLMCKDVCKPGRADLALTLTPIPADAIATTEFTDSEAGEGLLATLDALPVPLPAAWQASAVRLPAAKSAGAVNAPANAEPVADSLGTVRLTLRAADGATPVPAEPWYFDADAAIAYEQAQVRRAGTPAHELVVDLAISPYAEAAPTRLRGLLTFARGRAFAIDVPVTEATAADLAAPAGSPPAGAGAAADGGAAGGESGGGGKTGAAAAGGAPAPLAALLGLAFVGGLILNLMPCVFPVLGLKVMGFVQQAGEDRKKITTHGLVFTLGVLLSFWALAGVLALLRAGGDQLGWGFQLQEPRFVFAMAAVLLAFALNMSGVFEFALGATALGGGLQQKQGLAGSFFTGVLATVVATPCSAPFLAPALGAALALPAAQSFALFTAIALGLSAPYLTLAVFPGAVRALPRPGAWMETFKQGMAFPLYGTVGLLVWILAAQLEGDALLGALLALTLLAFALWLYGRATRDGRTRGGQLAAALIAGLAALLLGWPREATASAGELAATGGAGGAGPSAPAAGDEIVWEPWSAARVAQLRAEGRPIYVDFTARWCFTCQTNKKAVFAGPGSAEVKKRFRELNVATLRADWTKRDGVIAAELARFGRAAVPFNLVYLPGQDEPKILPELLVPSTVLAAFEG